MKKKHPKARLRMLVGADAYADRQKWHRAEELMAAIEFFPIGRGERLVTDRTVLAIPEISSTEIRERLRKGVSCRGLVPELILRDIDKHAGYRSPRV